MNFTDFLLLLLTIICLIILLRKIVSASKIDLFQPIVLTSAMFVIYFLIDIIYIVFDVQNNSEFMLSNKSFAYGDYMWPIFITLLSIIMWNLGDSLIASSKSYKVKASTINFEYKRSSMSLIAFLNLLLLLIQLVFMLNFINQIGGINYYLSNIADRALIFSEATTLYGFIQSTVIISSVLCGFFIATIKKERTSFTFKAVIILSLIMIVLLGISTGARANILKSIVVILVTYNFFGSKIKLNMKLVFSFVILGISLVIFAQLTRNVETEEQSFISSTYDSVEISQVNNIIIVNNNNLLGIYNGETIFGGLISFIPSSVYEVFQIEKPPGGNARFTENLWFERWDRAKSEVALGIFGEISMNFGMLILPIVSLLLGLMYKFTYNLLVANKILERLGLLIYIGILWSIFQLLRGDLFNTILNLFIFTLSCLIGIILIKLCTTKKIIKL